MSYLPDLQAYLDDLLRSKERLLAATELDDWAKADALPSEEEITRIRRLITRIKTGLDELTAAERDQIDQAVAVVRRHRAKALADGRRADSARRRQRVIAAINRAVTDGTEISVTAIARAAAVDRTFLYRHRDLLGQIHATQVGPPSGKPGANPGSVPPLTSAPLTTRSPIWNSRSSTCGSSSKNATANSPPPGPPTASSWPAQHRSTTPVTRQPAPLRTPPDLPAGSHRAWHPRCRGR